MRNNQDDVNSMKYKEGFSEKSEFFLAFEKHPHMFRWQKGEDEVAARGAAATS